MKGSDGRKMEGSDGRQVEGSDGRQMDPTAGGGSDSSWTGWTLGGWFGRKVESLDGRNGDERDYPPSVQAALPLMVYSLMLPACCSDARCLFLLNIGRRIPGDFERT